MARYNNPERFGHVRSRTDPGGLPPLSGGAHNYSIQTYNAVDLALNEMREGLDPRRCYTFCDQYLHRSLVPVNLEAQEKVRR